MSRTSDSLHHLAKPDDLLLFRSMGKSFRITAIFTNDDDANAHMARHPADAVIACFGPFIFLANKYSAGQG